MSGEMSPGKSEKMRPDPEFNTSIPCLILHHQKLTNDWGLHRLTGLVCVLVTKDFPVENLRFKNYIFLKP